MSDINNLGIYLNQNDFNIDKSLYIPYNIQKASYKDGIN